MVGEIVTLEDLHHPMECDHWALSVSVTIPRRHSKQRPDSSYEGEESDQRYMKDGS